MNQHVQNCLKWLDEALVDNKPVQAYNVLKELRREVNSQRMNKEVRDKMLRKAFEKQDSKLFEEAMETVACA